MKSVVRFATTLIATTLLFGCGGSDSSNTLDVSTSSTTNSNFKCNFWIYIDNNQSITQDT